MKLNPVTAIGVPVLVGGLVASAYLMGGLVSSRTPAQVASPTATIAPAVEVGLDTISSSVTALPESELPDRTSCEEIDGTDYRSQQEQQFYITNCIPTSTAVTPPVEPTPITPVVGTPVSVTPVPPTPVAPTPVIQYFDPKVVSTNPASGAIGVAADAKVVVKFSRYMDRADTQGAFTISHGNPGTFAWSASDTIMTFTPGADLPYGALVSFEISKTAQSAEGFAMKTDYASSFRILRQKTVTLVSQAAYDGFVFSPSSPVVNKVNPNGLAPSTWARGFLSFNLASLPSNLAEITSAEVRAYQSGHGTGAYGIQTGKLLVQSVTYGALSSNDGGRDTNHECQTLLCLVTYKGRVLSASAANGWKSANVTSYVSEDWQERALRGTRAQFRLRFEKENGAGPFIYAKFNSGNSASLKPVLKVTYLYP